MIDHVYIGVIAALLFVLIGVMQGIFERWYEPVLGSVVVGVLMFCIVKVLGA